MRQHFSAHLTPAPNNQPKNEPNANACVKQREEREREREREREIAHLG